MVEEEPGVDEGVVVVEPSPPGGRSTVPQPAATIEMRTRNAANEARTMDRRGMWDLPPDRYTLGRTRRGAVFLRDRL